MSEKNDLELKHHKDFHGIQFQDFKVKDRNLIFALCYKLMNQESNVLEFDVKEIAKISNYKPTKAKDNIYKSLEESYKAIKNASICIKKENGVKHFVLFTVFETFEDKGIVRIKVNEEYRYLLNQVTKPFTIQNVLEYTKLSSGYSQLLYSLLKEWEKVKSKEWDIKEFRRLLGVPESYLMNNLDKRVLKPIMEELPEHFYNLKLEKIYTGRKVSSLKFTWGAISRKKTLVPEELQEEIFISPILKNTIEKAKKNRFINPYLIDGHIKLLLEMFSVDELIHGLNFAYREIKKEFKSLRYLVKTIETSLEKKEIKIKIKDDNCIQTKLNNISPGGEKSNIKPKQERNLKKVTQKQFDILYQGFLIQNDEEDNPFIKTTFGFNYIIIDDKSTSEDQELSHDFNPVRLQKIYSIEDINSDQLLDKKGRKLVGMALQMRVKKILKEMNKKEGA